MQIKWSFQKNKKTPAAVWASNLTVALNLGIAASQGLPTIILERRTSLPESQHPIKNSVGKEKSVKK